MTIHSDSPGYQSFERMSSGAWHIPGGPEQIAAHNRCWPALKELNDLGNLNFERARELLTHILAPGSHVPEMFTPFHVEYGVNTTFGPDCFVNFNLTVLDAAPVRIGARAMIGPGCQFITINHPVRDVEMRRLGWEKASPITIGEDCWFGAGVMVMPSVTIGDRCVLAAGSVVTKDIPADSLVAGVPGRIVRSLDQAADPLEREEIEALRNL